VKTGQQAGLCEMAAASMSARGSTLLAIDKVRGDFLAMVINAASLLALYGTANPLIQVVLPWAKFLFANSVSLVFHVYD
jgi:hypothetical protein